MAAVPIADDKAAVWHEVHVCRAVLRFVSVVFPCFLWQRFAPDYFALKSTLDDCLHACVRKINEFVAALLADIDAVASSVLVFTEGLDILAPGIKDNDRVTGFSAIATVGDVDESS